MAEGPVITAAQKAWRRVSRGIQQGANFKVPEVSELKNLRREDQPFSFRENEIIVELNEDGGIATIGEGDFEAETGTVDPESGTLSISHMNGRFDISNLAKYADKGGENQLETELVRRGTKKIEALNAHVGDYFYGSTSGTLALCDLNVSAQTTLTLTLYAGYGNTNITNASYLVRKFKPQVNSRGGDVVALVNGSSLVANSFARVTARDATLGTLTVAVISGSVTVNATGLKVVKANSKGRTTIAHTDYNRGLAGMQDILFASAYHGLTHDAWLPSKTSSTSGRFTFADILAADDEISDLGDQDAMADRILIDPAVYNDMVAYERAGLRHTSTDMSLDGKVKSEGRRFIKSKRVPPGWVISYNSRALKRWEILDAPSSPPRWGDGKEYIDLSGMVFRVERVLGLVVTNRRLFTVAYNKTRSAA